MSGRRATTLGVDGLAYLWNVAAGVGRPLHMDPVTLTTGSLT